MTTTAVFAEAIGHADIYGSSTVYATARAGTGSLALDLNGVGIMTLGQQFGSPTYRVVEGFLSFDTSSIPDTDAVSAAILALWCNVDQSTTDHTLNARLRDFGATLTTADFVAGASLTGITPLLAHLATSGITASVHNNFTDDAMPANINKTGSTRMIIVSDRLEAGTTPTATLERTQWTSGDWTGTSLDPTLTVTHAAVSFPRSQAVIIA